jgi:hypothetical protein
MEEDAIGGAEVPSWQTMVNVGTSIVPLRAPPATTDTLSGSAVATTPQVTASFHDFAVSLIAASRLAGADQGW